MRAAAAAAAKLRDDQKYAQYSRSGSTVYTLVPLPHESYGRLGHRWAIALNCWGIHLENRCNNSDLLYLLGHDCLSMAWASRPAGS